MGLCNSSAAVREVWGQACNYNLTQVAALVREFKDNGYSYSMTASAIGRLLQVDASRAEAIFARLQQQNDSRSICASNLLIALSMIAKIDPQTSMGQDRIAVCFSVFDFNSSGELSKDELTLLFLAVQQTLAALTEQHQQLQLQPAVAAVSQASQLADKVFKACRLAESGTISRSQLSKYLRTTNPEGLESPDKMLEWMAQVSPTWLFGHHTTSPADPAAASLSFAELAENLMARALLEAEMEKGFPCITSQHTSLMAKHLTPARYAQLHQRKTDNRFTIDDAIQSGLRLPECKIGVIAGDLASYELFHELFHPIIADWHGFGDASCTSGLWMQQSPLLASYHPNFDSPRDHKDFPAQYVNSTKILFKRNLEGSRLVRLNTRGERRTVEKLFLDALKVLADAEEDEYAYASEEDEFETDEDPDDEEGSDGNGNGKEQGYIVRPSTTRPAHSSSRKRWYDGKYYPATVAELPIFATWQRQAGLCTEWEDARGFYVSQDGTLRVAVNADDHFTFELHYRSGFANPFTMLPQLVFVVKAFQKELIKRGWGFMYHDRFGYITSCPSFVGTGFVVEMDLTLPRLSRQEPELVEQLLERLGLASVCPNSGQRDDRDSICVRNMQTFSVLETQIMDFFLASTAQLIKFEEQLAAGETTLEQLLHETRPRRRREASTQNTPRTARSSCSARSRIPSTMALKDLVVDDFPRFPASSRWITTHLSKRLYQQLKDVVSPSGWTLDKTIRPAIELAVRGRRAHGIMVGDTTCYNLLHAFLRLVLEVHHPNIGRQHHISDIRIRQLPRQALVMSEPTMVRRASIACYRCIDNWNFPASLRRQERNSVCKLLVDALLQMAQDSHSSFTPLTSIDGQTEALPVSWTELECADCLNDWPDGRGVYKSGSGNTSVWVNLVEHVCATTSREDGDMVAAFEEAHDALLSLSRQLALNDHKFAFSDRLGFLHPEPAKLGTGMSVQVEVHLPSVGTDENAMEAALDRLGLVDSFDGAATDDPSWFRFVFGGQIGMSEAMLLQQAIAHTNTLITVEKACQTQGTSVASSVTSVMSATPVKPH